MMYTILIICCVLGILNGMRRLKFNKLPQTSPDTIYNLFFIEIN
jgi:hypothetical protein